MTSKKSTSYRAVLGNSAFRVLWLNEILVQLSFNMINFALIVQVFSLTGRNTLTSLFVLTSVLPAVVFGVFTGVVADMVDKRKILLLSDIALGFCFAAFLIGQYHFAAILSLALLLNIALQFFIPAEAAAIPMIVPKDQLLTANALFYFVLTVSALVGYSIAGPIVNRFGNDVLFIFGAVAMSIGFLLRRTLPPLVSSATVKVPKRQTFSQTVSLTLVHIAEGITHLRTNPRIWIPVSLLVVTQMIAAVLVTVGPGYMEQVLSLKATHASLAILFPIGLGLVIGTLTIGKFGGRLPRRYLMIGGAIGSGVAIIGLGLVPLIYQLTGLPVTAQLPLLPFYTVPIITLFVGLCSFSLGVASAGMVVPGQTILQNATTATVRGRIFSILETLKAVVAAMPILLAGTFADIFGIVPIVLVIGGLLLTASLISTRFLAFETVLKS